jgi:branched-chain amino acid transport system permease protein
MIGALIEQLINGISLGMVYALIALGYTMVYGILRMINFSHGEVFMVGGFVGWGVISGLLSVGGVPSFAILLAALSLAVLLCGALGYCIERFAYRPLRNARSMGVIISGLGVSIFLQTAAILIFGTRFRLIETQRIIPNDWYLAVGDVRVPFIRILIMAVSLGLMLGLDHFVRRTRWGKAVRATAQDLEAAAFLGIDIDRVVSLVYVLGSALAGIGGVLVGMLYTQVDFAFGFFIGIKAFTAAVIGGIGNIRGALLGGLILGVAESLAAGLISPTFKDVTTFVLLAAVLLMRPTGLLGKKLRVREAVATTPAASGRAARIAVALARAAPLGRLVFPEWLDRRVAVVAGVALILAFPLLVETPYYVRVGAAIGLAAMMTGSLCVVTGWAGQLSLGHIGFYAVGAYVYAFLASSHFGVHLPFLPAVAAAAGVAGVIGLAIGAVSLRLSGDYLAMVTLAFAEIVRNLLISLDRPIDLTGGVNGILSLDMPTIGGIAVEELGAYYYLIWGFALIALAGLGRLHQSKVGRAWLAIREDEVAAAHMGIDLFRYKVLAFTMAAMLAAVAGSLFAAWQGSVFPDSFTLEQTAVLYAMLVVSGAAGMPGIVVGAAALTIIPELLRDYGVYRMLLFGALLVLVMRYRPQGLFTVVPRRSTAASVGNQAETSPPAPVS